jgi:hypothetical protein
VAPQRNTPSPAPCKAPGISAEYAEGDFEAMKIGLENEAAMVLAEIEQVTDSQGRRSRAAQSAPADGSAP